MTADGTEAFLAAAQALNEAGDKELRKEVYAAFRRVAKPLGERMIAEGAAELPHRGGLAARVAAARLSQSNATTGRNPAVAIKLKVREGYNLRTFDQGTIRHRVFGSNRWVAQSIRAGAFTRPFEAGADQVRKELIAALEKVANGIREGTEGGKFKGHI
ncbi:MAG TPA: hypothetical protein VGH54_21600 [Mycobacterium sp.]|uniref:hypothetical protein n=1 Tax=Mycobacterium sp. TaxID=1785 RepID=UPI002F412951